MVYGIYTPPFNLKRNEFDISVESNNGYFIYRRKLKNGKQVEKNIIASDFKIYINPVEPLNTPQEITSFLMIEFSRSFTIAPKMKRKIYILHPVEIGVIAFSKKKNFEIIDVFTLNTNKFTLYGEMKQGVICKYYKSDVFFDLPNTDPLREGVIELELINKTDDWINLSRVVFNVYLMKIYYDEEKVVSRAQIEIKSDVWAETSFIDKPFEKDMNKSIELFIAKKLPVLPAEFVMEWGL